MMWKKKNFCPGQSRGDKMCRQRQSTERHRYTFHRINTAIAAKITVTTFLVSRIKFSGCNAERADNKYNYTDKTNPQIHMKFMEVIMQLQHLTVRRMQPGSYSFGLALCSPEDAI
jgi:hypothetical protein